MRPEISVVVAPVAVIDLTRAKLHCRIDGAERDAEVTDAIEAARAWTQERLRRAVGEQTLDLTYRAWCGSAELPFQVTELLSVTVDGVAVAPLPALAGRLLTLDVTGTVVVRIKTGYTAATLPGPVKNAMLLLVGDLVRNTQAQTEGSLNANPALESLLYPYIAEVSL